MSFRLKWKGEEDPQGTRIRCESPCGVFKFEIELQEQGPECLLVAYIFHKRTLRLPFGHVETAKRHTHLLVHLISKGASSLRKGA